MKLENKYIKINNKFGILQENNNNLKENKVNDSK